MSKRLSLYVFGINVFECLCISSSNYFFLDPSKLNLYFGYYKLINLFLKEKILLFINLHLLVIIIFKSSILTYQFPFNSFNYFIIFQNHYQFLLKALLFQILLLYKTFCCEELIIQNFRKK